MTFPEKSSSCSSGSINEYATYRDGLATEVIQEETEKEIEEEVEVDIKEEMTEENHELVNQRNNRMVTDESTNKETEGETVDEVHPEISNDLRRLHLQPRRRVAQRDWSTIPPDIANSISRKVGYICDYLHFRAVCKSWYFNVPLADLRPQFPWIMKVRHLPYEATLHFYSVTTEKEYSTVVPEASDKYVFGSLNGYLIVEARRLSLLNPLTKNVIQLPSNNYDNNVGLLETKFGELYIIRIGFTDTGIYALLRNRAMDSWKKIPLGDKNYLFSHFCPGEMLVSVHYKSGITKVTNITTGTIAYQFQGFPRREGTEHMVMVSNEITRVFCDINGAIDIHRLDVVNKCWLKLGNIGSKALFVDKDSCYALEAFPGSGIRENTVYHKLELGPDMLMQNLETNDRQTYRVPWEDSLYWYIPKLDPFRA